MRTTPLSETTKKGKKRPQRSVPVNITIQTHASGVKPSPHVLNLKNPAPATIGAVVPIRRVAANSASARTPKPPRAITIRPSIDIDFTRRHQSPLPAALAALSWRVNRYFERIPLIQFRRPAVTARPNSAERAIPADIFALPSTREFHGWLIPRDWFRPLATFAVVAVIVVSPLQALSYYQHIQGTKDTVLALTNDAVSDLWQAQSTAMAFDLSAAGNYFDQARNSFGLAHQQITQLDFVTAELLKLLPDQERVVDSGSKLLAAGELIADAGSILSDAGNSVVSTSGQDYYTTLVVLHQKTDQALDRFSQARTILSSVHSDDLPVEHRAAFEHVVSLLPTIQNSLQDFSALNQALLTMVGQSGPHRYLVIFTNNNELRATGGFMGSFAVMTVDHGSITHMDIPAGGTYDVQGQLVPRVLSPEPLHLINPRWEFQDANWWPDFPSSAKKIQWFYTNAGGAQTDGVIILSATLMERLLAVVGPIAMPDYGRVITQDNFVAETQKIVEVEYDRQENRPKQFIADLAPQLLDRVLAARGEALTKVLNVLHQALNEKHLLIYSVDPSVESVIKKFGWAGDVRSTNGDFLSVVHTNLAGGKTDGVITEVIQHQAVVQPDGSIIDTVHLRRTHHGVAGSDIFTGVQNNSYVRLYVPAGSTLLSATGFNKPANHFFQQPDPDLVADSDLTAFERNHQRDSASGTDVYEESGKTVFGNWLQLKPGQTTEAVIEYRLPFSLAAGPNHLAYYSLLIQKQSGAVNDSFEGTISLPSTFKPVALYPDSVHHDGSILSWSTPLDTDHLYGAAVINQ